MSYKEYTVRIHSNGTKEWFINGQHHREDGPAIEFATGEKWWYLNGNLHREDGPAVEHPDGPIGCRWNNDTKKFSPPVKMEGTKEWYLNGKRHREDGPAYEGVKKAWYLDGERLTEAQFLARKNSCVGKVVEIDGKKYTLQPV